MFSHTRLVKMRHVTEYAPAKNAGYPSDIPQLSKLHLLQKIFEG